MALSAKDFADINASLQADRAAAEAQYNATRSRTAGEVVSDLGAQVLQGAVGLGQAAYGAANLATLGYLDRGVGLSQNFRATNEILNAWKSDPTRGAQAEAQRRFQQEGIMSGLGAYLSNPALLQDVTVQALPSLLPGAAVARYAGGAAAAAGLGQQAIANVATRGVLGATALQAGGQTNIDAINAVRAAGGDENLQQLGGLSAGAIAGGLTPIIGRATGAGALEAAVANRLAGGALAGVPGQGLTRAIGAGAAREGVEEYLQSGVQQAATNAVVPGTPLMEGVAQQAALGGLLGVGLGGALGGVAYRPIVRATPESAAIQPELNALTSELGVSSSRVFGNEVPFEQVPITPTAPDWQIGGETDAIPFTPTSQQPAPIAPNWLMENQVPAVILQPPITVDTQGVATVPGAPPPVVETPDVAGQRLQEFASAVQPPRMSLQQAVNAAVEQGTTDPVRPLTAVDLEMEQRFIRGEDGKLYRRDLLEQQGEAVEVPARQAQEEAAAAVPTWEGALTRLGIKPSAYRSTSGKAALAQLVSQAEAAGVLPGDPAFLRQYVDQNAESPLKLHAELQRVVPEVAQDAEPAPSNDADVPGGTVAGGLGRAEPTAEVVPAVAAEPAPVTAEPEQPVVDAGAVADVVAPGTGGQPAGGVGDAVSGDTRVDDAYQPYFDTLATIGAGAPTRGLVARQVNQAKAEGLITKEEAQTLRGQKGAVDMLDAFQALLNGKRSDAQARETGGLTQDATRVRDTVDTLVEQRQRAGDTPQQADASAIRQMQQMLHGAVDGDDLDNMFEGIKASRTWARMTPAQQDAVVTAMNDAAEEGRFSRAPGVVAAPVESQQFNELVENANRLLGTQKVTGFDSVAAARSALGVDIPADARGVYDSGQVYLIRENLRDATDLAMVLGHERAHEGMAGLLGDKLSAITSRIMANPALRKRVTEKMQAEGLSRALAGEEVLADMVANRERLTGDVMGKIRSAIRNLFDRSLGLKGLTVSDADVDELLQAAAKYRNGDVFAGAMTDEAKYQRLDELLTAPDKVSTLRYSRVSDDLSRALSPEPSAEPRNLAAPVKNWVTDSAKNLGESFRTGGVFRFTRSLMGLDRQYQADGKLFDNPQTGANPFRDLVDNIDRKDADTNKLLHAPTQAVYRSPEYLAARAAAQQKYADQPAKLQSVLSDLAGKHSVEVSTKDTTARWLKLKEADRKALDAVQQFGTYYRLFPDRGMDQQFAYEANNAYTDTERKQALAQLNGLWKRLTPEAQAIYKESQADYGLKWSQRFDALANELSATMGVSRDSPEFQSAFGNDLRAALQRIETGPYSPLQRYGNYFVTVRDKNGGIDWFSAYDSKADADRAAALAGQRAQPGQTVATSLRTEFQYPLDAISKAKVDTLTKAIDGIPNLDDATRTQVKDSLVDAYLSSLPSHAFLQHANKRKMVGGFTTDALRAYNDYGVKAARTIASLRHDGNISRNLAAMQSFATEQAQAGGDVTRLNAVVNAARDQRAAAANAETNPIAEKLTAASFAQFMTSPSQLFVNAMQTPLVAIPRIAAQQGVGGVGKTLAATKEALALFTRSRGDMLGPKSAIGGDVKQVLTNLFDNGKLDFTLTHELAAIGRGSGDAVDGHWRKVMEVASAAMHRSEVFNRQVTAYVSAKLALDRGASVEQATKLASRAIDDTHFNYSQSVAPTALQGPWKRMFFQFQKYRLNMLAMLANDIRLATSGTPEEKATARRTLAYMLGTQAALTGAVGTAVAPVAFAILDAFRDDDDLVDSRTAFVQSVPQLISHGLLAGFIDPSRVESGSVLPFFGDRQYAPKNGTPKEEASYYLTKYMGPSFGMLTNAYEGVNGAFEGDGKTALKMLPKPFADVAKSAMELDGARTKSGAVYFEPDAWDTATGLVGLRSADRLAAEERRSAGVEATSRIKTVRQRYLTQYALGRATGDNDLIQEVNEKVILWNRAHPELAIKASDLARASKGVRDTEENAQRYGVTTSRRLPQSVIDAIEGQ